MNRQEQKKHNMKPVLRWCAVVPLLSALLFAQSNSSATPAPENSKTPAKITEKDVKELREALAAQQQQIAAQQQQIKQQQEMLERLSQKVQQNPNATPDAPQKQANQAPNLGQVASTTPMIPAGSASSSSSVPALNTSISANPDNQGVPESPLQLKVGSAYITPVGFMDFTSVWRSRNGGSGIGTNFAGIPYRTPDTFQSNLSESRFSMQNSRIGFRVDANVKGSHVIGYMEADFLGNNPTNVAVSSNSNTLRSRLYWVDLRHSQWEVLGGQTWSLATPNRVGVSPLPGDVFFSYNMDVNYQAGMVWGRIPEFRVAYHFPNDKAAFAIALDSPEQYAGGTNGSAAATYPAALSKFYPGGELNNGTTTLGVPNRAPDVISKIVFDPSKRLHAEVGGLARFFQLYNPVTATHYSATGGAGFVNLDFGLTNELRVLTHNYWGDGGGRYIFGQAPDLIARADGSPSLLHAGSTVDGLEYTHKNTTLFSYYGLVYINRNVTLDADGKPIGWGYTGAPNGQNRSVQEGTFGFIQNFWKDAKYGALSLIGQYSYLTRNPWYVATGNPNNAHANMVFIDLRYTLPGSAPTMGKPGKE
jgi:hypothetical protein